jgi:hypothetical protein
MWLYQLHRGREVALWCAYNACTVSEQLTRRSKMKWFDKMVDKHPFAAMLGGTLFVAVIAPVLPVVLVYEILKDRNSPEYKKQMIQNAENESRYQAGKAEILRKQRDGL